jgi:hypothetical protein
MQYTCISTVEILITLRVTPVTKVQYKLTHLFVRVYLCGELWVHIEMCMGLVGVQQIVGGTFACKGRS